MIFSAVHIAHTFIKQIVRAGDTVIDATAGNGFDTLFLCSLVGTQGIVYSIDIQAEAIEHTKHHVKGLFPEHTVHFYIDSHEYLDTITANIYGGVSCIMFNLGYLPGSLKKHITTKASTTLRALQQSARLLNDRGLLSVLCYRGHPGGIEEFLEVEQFMNNLDSTIWQVIKSEAVNQMNTAPIVFMALKKQD